jgi:hypothetical protein
VVAAPATAPLRYCLTDLPEEELGYLSGQSLEPGKKPGEKLRSEPDYASDYPLYLTATLGQGQDRRYTLVLDESRGTGRGYDTLYVDRDNDEALDDEKPLRGYRREGACWFGPIPLLLRGENGPYLHHFLCACRSYSEDYHEAELQTAAYYVGQAEIAGARRQIALVDGNGNGVFNDLSTEPEEGDLVLLDLNDDGSFETAEEDAEEVYGLGRYLLIRDRYYALTVADEGASLAISEPDLKFGTLRTGLPHSGVQMSSEEGFFTFRSPGPEIRVPVGTYRLQACTLEARDDEGNVWTNSGEPSGKGAAVTIREGKTTRLAYGPPLKVTVVPEVEEEEVEFNLQVTGQAGERYGEFTRNGTEVPPPRLRIADADGKEVGTYDFHYG